MENKVQGLVWFCEVILRFILTKFCCESAFHYNLYFIPLHALHCRDQ